MSPEQEAGPSVDQPQTQPPTEPQRRERRPGRGHRGRGRRRRPPPPTQAPTKAATGYASSAPPDEAPQFSPEPPEVPFEELPEAAETEPAEFEPVHHPEPVRSREATSTEEPKRPPLTSLQDAIDQVNQVVDSLREALNGMEEVMELLELFERQSGADEREIESLRRALRQFQRPPDRGQPRRGRS